MQTGTQLCAPDGYDMLAKDAVYHLLRSDPVKQRVLLVEFRPKPAKLKLPAANKSQKRLSETTGNAANAAAPVGDAYAAFKPILHFLSRQRFENALDEGLIQPCENQEELPPWFSGSSVEELRCYAEPRSTRKKSHADRIDRTLLHLWPLVENLDQILAADVPDALINAHARACRPVQHETRLRTSFYAYVCFGFSRWALHYIVQHIGRWDRMGRDRKFGRPSRLHGSHYGFGSNDQDMIQKILEGYRKFAGPGQHLSRAYRSTLTKVFGCVTQTDPSGRKYYVHPAGEAFPSIGQFAYRVAQAFPLEVRQTYKYGHTRVRSRLTHSQGHFAESAGNVMERTEQDAYYCDEVSKGYLPGSHLPPLWVVRIRCIASGMMMGIGFSAGSETASAYRMALFCAAIDKVKFCSLFGLYIKPEDWPSVGISPYAINDRGPGSTAKADSADPAYRPIIKEGTPSYAGKSKASIETTNPKPTKLEGKPYFLETRLSIPQLAVQEITRTIADNHSIDITDRLNNSALTDRVLPTPASLWQYLDRKGRSHAVTMRFEEAVRAYLTPIELTVRDDAVYFKDGRFDSEKLKLSGALQKAHSSGRYPIKGYMLDVCVRHLWVEVGSELVEVDAMLSIRDGYDQLYISVVEIEQMQQLRRDAKLEVKSHRRAAKSEYETMFEKHTGQPFEQAVVKGGRNRRSKAASVQERQEIMPYLRAEGGRR